MSRIQESGYGYQRGLGSAALHPGCHTLSLPGAAHGTCSCTPVAVALCLGTSGDTPVSVTSPMGWLCHAQLEQGSAWWNLMVPLRLGHL